MARVNTSVTLLGCFTAAFFVVYWLLVLPSMQSFGTQQAEMAANDAALAGRPVVVKNSNKPIISQKVHDQVIELLPRDNNHLDLAIQLEALTKELGIPYSAITIGAADAATTAAGATAKIPITFSADGSLADAENVINRLSSIGRYIQIDQVALSQPTTGTGKLHALINASAYYLASDSSTSSKSASIPSK